ncbi:MAG: helix-turn-helix domain-containing protein [bacterium]|nr:helix-turn-helix domain-containing protein [bacterium]
MSREKSLYTSIKLFVENAPADEIGSLTVTSIARKFNINRSYLSRVFSKYNYLPLSKYLELYKFIRFHSVTRGLKNPTVKEALEKMGIKNASNFTQRFKDMWGKTPGQHIKE